MQFQADILNCPSCEIPRRKSLPGRRILAGLATGFWSDLEEIAALPRQFERFDPNMPDSQRKSSTKVASRGGASQKLTLLLDPRSTR
jgi:glycerol kinase